MPKRRRLRHNLRRGQHNSGHSESKQNLQRSRSSLPGKGGSRKGPRTSPKEVLSESSLEQSFFECWSSRFSPEVTQQHRFHPTRQWRFDFCWPDLKVAVEIQGFGAGHNSYKGMSSDYEKHNAACALGWKIFYLMSHDLTPEAIIDSCTKIQHYLQGKPYEPSRNTERFSGRANDSIDRARRRLLEGFD